MGNQGILAATGAFCKTKQFVVGTGGTSVIFSVIILGFVNPMITANGSDIDSNEEYIKSLIGITASNANALSNIDNSLQKLDGTLEKFDGTMEKFDERLDKMTLIMCDISNGQRC